jgi:hypothetical protein
MDSAAIAAAVRHSSRLELTQFKSASRCRPVPATPSTDPTVIPGTDPTPATPPIVIPGGPGMPDTVIPGTPGKPGTPPTVIGGSPGSPGSPCPPPPAVTSEPVLQTESLALRQPQRVTGTLLPAGTYIASSGKG